jgi:hypothetical protein
MKKTPYLHVVETNIGAIRLENLVLWQDEKLAFEFYNTNKENNEPS